jgi:glyoxylase I family protein
MIYPGLIDHLVFRIADLDRTERFYTKLLGQPSCRDEESLMYITGGTRLFFTLVDESQKGTYDKENVGLNHMAFGVRTTEELHAIQEQLSRNRITHSGIQLDTYGLKEFIWLDDPDGMRIEFYLRA